MAVIETWFEQDLQKPVKVRYIDGNLFSHNGNGNRIGVIITNNGEPVTLTGTVSGYAVLADGTTVPCTGTRSGNKASILVPAAAYSPGSILISIFLTDGTTVTTLAALSSSVIMARTGNQIDPGTVVTDWTNTINAAMQSVETAAANLGNIIATPYANLTFPVPLGKYTIYNNALYRCISPIASSEAWTAAHWTIAKLGDDVRDLKSAINKPTLKNLFTTENATPGRYVTNSGGLGTNASYSATDYIPVTPGKKYRLYNMADNYLLIGAPGVYANAGKTAYSAITANTVVNHAVYREITVPEGYYFIRLSYITADADNYYLTEEIEEDIIQAILPEIPASSVIDAQNLLVFSEIKNAYIIADGSEVSATGFTYTDYIALLPYTLYTLVNCRGADGNPLGTPGFMYNAEKAGTTILTALQKETYTDDSGNYYLTFYTKNLTFIRVNAYSPYIDSMKLYKGYPVVSYSENGVDLYNITDGNLFVPNGIPNKYWNGGSAVTMAGFGYTDPIPVKANTKYTISNILGADGALLGSPGNFTTASGQNIGSIKTGWITSSDGINQYVTIETPSNASYVILNYYKTFVDIMTMVEGDKISVLNSLCLGSHALAQIRRIAGVTKATYKIAFLGDSITYGVGASFPYWRLIANETGWNCLNLGKGGTGYCTRYNSDDNFNDRVSLIPSDVDCVVVFGGTNDYGNGSGIVMGDPTDTDISTFYGGVNQLFNTLCNNYPHAPKVILTPLRRADDGGGDTPNARGYTLGDYVNAIKNRANAFAFPVCDLYVDSELSPDMNATILSTFFTDNVHPNNAGHEMFYKFVLAKIKEVLH